ncbi:MAG TPA: glycosyl hydrolase [Solirubrobacterales bacterium]|nr:glycosyl hydrolase [Solirubrobacterales bacterium]
MARAGDTLRLKAALIGTLALALSAAVAFAIAAPQAPAAPGPRVTLSVPAEVTEATPATAKGRIVPAQRGRVLIRAWRAHAWRQLGAGAVRGGKFRISFSLPQGTPSELRLRATLVRGRRPLADSPIRRVQVRPAAAAPAPKPSAPTAPTVAPRPAVADNTPSLPAEEPPGGGEEPPGEEPGGEEEPPGGEEEPPPPPPPGNAYWGAWIGPQLTGEAAPWDMSAVTEFEQMVGKPLSLLEFSSPWADCSKSPCTNFNFPTTPFESIRAHGAIPFFSWGSQSIPGSPNQPNFQLADIIAGSHDSYITSWATRAAEWGHPFFLRFDWEMNGDWFPWGEFANENQPGEFATAWRHVHDLFVKAGATNASWVWCPYINHTSLYASLYPGDAYVDWTCLDGYNWGENPAAPYGWKTFDELFANSYAKITEKTAPSKPLALGEFASSEYGPAGTSKAGWIEDMFEALALRYPKVDAVVYFENLGNGMDWKLESSQSAADAFAAGIDDSRFLGNVFGSLNTSPIPSP